MVTAIAHPNIALIKYWGKKDEQIILPATSSISLTVGEYKTETSVVLNAELSSDSAVLNGKELVGVELSRVSNLLQHIRDLAGSSSYAQIVSTNTVPTAAGLASSASGFAALAVAGSKAYGLDLQAKDLSRIARRGSGSAARSLFGGMVIWHAGHDDESSYAEPLQWQGEELEMLVAEISADRKALSSRKAMQMTEATSPFYQSWVQSNSELVEEALGAIKLGDLETLGTLTELSTMRMHAVMQSAAPSIRYLSPKSWEVLDAVQFLRSSGMSVYATADAGPNIKILTTASSSQNAVTELRERFPEIKFLSSGMGEAARVIKE